MICLKPCCLPPLVHADRDEVFTCGKHSFKAKEVCSAGKFNGNKWTGPPRNHLEGKFNKWVKNLELCMDIDVDVEVDADEKILSQPALSHSINQPTILSYKTCEHHELQVDGGFQNKYLFAYRGSAGVH